jgi:recombinational DNA repair protein (RecF pathway)
MCAYFFGAKTFYDNRMQEYISEAIVLNKEPLRDLDGRYSFFTKRYGKLTGKATSTRKITSKLAGHLEPGTLVHVRLVEKGGAQIVDALKKAKLPIALPDLRFVNAMLTEGEPDLALWNELTAERFSWENILRVMGWDPQHASCEHCGKTAVYFYFPRQEFFCASCASNFGRNELLLVSHA